MTGSKRNLALFHAIVAASMLMSWGNARAESGTKEKKIVKETAEVVSPEAFQQKVEEAGGRVDFVFEDDRPFKECHASTVVQGADGNLLCAWFGGTKEKNPDVGIWMSRFDATAWSNPERAAKVDERAHWNPVLFRDAGNGLHLFFKVGVNTIVWQTYWTSSQDNGATWTKPAELVPGDIGGRGPVKNKAFVLSDGTWLAPASTEEKKRLIEVWEAFADRSTDGGKTWMRSENFAIDRKTLKGAGAIQPTFWESAPGKVHALMRTSGRGIWRVDSEDGGKTWSPVYATDLPNNNSGIDALGLEDGRVLLVYNPVRMNWGPRTPLDLTVSKDNGKTWTTVARLEDNPDLKSEFSYPAIVRTKTGIAVCYTWHRQRVRCWQIPMAALD